MVAESRNFVVGTWPSRFSVSFNRISGTMSKKSAQQKAKLLKKNKKYLFVRVVPVDDAKDRYAIYAR